MSHDRQASTRTPRRPTHRRTTTAAALALAALFLSACLTAGQQQDLDLINQARKANRKATVVANDTATAKAQRWSDHMARTGVLEHTGGGTRVDPAGLPRWCSMGENVGYGPSVASVHDAFLRSASHKANMLGAFDRVGVGVTTKGRTVWVTEIYYRSC